MPRQSQSSTNKLAVRDRLQESLRNLSCGCEIVLAAMRSRRSPLFKLFSPPLGFLLIADQYKQLQPAEPACFLVM
jgi:hypothetical protein